MTHVFSKNKVAMILLVLLLAVCLVAGLFCTGAFASQSDHDRISIATAEPVGVTWANVDTDTGVVAKVDPTSNYYPASFFLYVDSTIAPTINNGGTIAAMPDYDTSYGKAYKVTLPAGSASTITTQLTTYDDNNGTYYLTCSAPAGSIAGSATLPADVDGYLPVGQFATGQGWGSIYSDGTNLAGTTKKFLSGYTSYGVSLGACGGYVQYDFGANPIGNNNTNPYGVDFVVYGNAFNGNPEAGAVKVSNDGTTWYELAGSNYYNTSTLKNVNVTYKKVTTAVAPFNSTGVWYKITDASNNTITNWTLFKNSTAWWPEYSSEGYGSVWNFNSKVGGVTWNTGDNEITYSGVTLLTDSDTTNFYPYGYVDVRANGTANGNAINPYADAPASSRGGAGFDLSWAVTANGQPINLSSVKYVRVYTAAGLNAASNALVVGGFGETSTEVCGIYSTANTAGSDVGVTAAPTITPTTAPASTVTADKSSTSHMITYTYNNAGTYTFTATPAAANTNLYINDARYTAAQSWNVTLTSGDTKYYRVVVQDGTSAQANVYVIKIRCQ